MEIWKIMTLFSLRIPLRQPDVVWRTGFGARLPEVRTGSRLGCVCSSVLSHVGLAILLV